MCIKFCSRDVFDYAHVHGSRPAKPKKDTVLTDRPPRVLDKTGEHCCKWDVFVGDAIGALRHFAGKSSQGDRGAHEGSGGCGAPSEHRRVQLIDVRTRDDELESEGGPGFCTRACTNEWQQVCRRGGTSA